MKRVLIFSLAYLPRHIGGAEIAIKEITDRIPQDEIEFHMITNRYNSTLPREEQIGNVLVHRIGIVRTNPSMADLRRFPLHLNKGLYQFLAFFYAIRLHRTYHYDGIWAMMAHATGVPVAAFNLCFPRVPYLLSLQEGDPPEYIERTMRPLWPLFARSFKRAAMVQSLSTFLEAWSRRRGAARTTVIPNGVDLRRFMQTLSAERRDALRTSFGVSASDTLLVTASRLVPKNGVDTLLHSLALLPQNVRLLIAGAGPEMDRLQKLAQELSLSPRIHFYGEAGQEEIPDLLFASDVFVRASRSEGQGISFIEAMAAGLPTVGTSVGGIVDFLKEGETGFLAKPEDPQDVADAIGRAMAPESRAVALRGTALVRERYDWDLIARLMREQCFSLF